MTTESPEIDLNDATDKAAQAATASLDSVVRTFADASAQLTVTRLGRMAARVALFEKTKECDRLLEENARIISAELPQRVEIERLRKRVAELRDLLQEIADADLAAEDELRTLGLALPEMSVIRKKIMAALAPPQADKAKNTEEETHS